MTGTTSSGYAIIFLPTRFTVDAMARQVRTGRGNGRWDAGDLFICCDGLIWLLGLLISMGGKHAIPPATDEWSIPGKIPIGRTYAHQGPKLASVSLAPLLDQAHKAAHLLRKRIARMSNCQTHSSSLHSLELGRGRRVDPADHAGHYTRNSARPGREHILMAMSEMRIRASAVWRQLTCTFPCAVCTG